MTTDRELLELAAKAAGIKALLAPDGVLRDCTGRHEAQNIFSAPTWNPLTDDGDALRLAVNFGLLLRNRNNLADAYSREYSEGTLPKDNYAAMRRAIVRAAADIGKQQ